MLVSSWLELLAQVTSRRTAGRKAPGRSRAASRSVTRSDEAVVQALEPRRLFDATLYVMDYNNYLKTLDTATGTLTQITKIYGFGVNAFAESTANQFYGVGSGDFPYFSMNITTGNSTQISYLNYTSAMAFSPSGTLYAASSGIQSVNPTTGEESTFEYFSNGLTTSDGSMAFDGQGDLFMVDNHDNLDLVNPANGDVGVIGPTGFTGFVGIAFGSDGTLYGVTDPSVGSVNQVISINPDTGAGTLVSTFNDYIDAVTAVPANSSIAAPPFPPASPLSSPPTSPPSTTGLTPSIIKSTLPAAIVGGTTVHGTVTLSVANTGTTTDSASVSVYGSTDGSIDGSSILLGKYKPKIDLKAGKSETVSVPVSYSSVPAGTYTLLANATDSSSNSVDSGAGPTLTAAAPFVSLAETVTTVNLASSVVSGTKSNAMAKVVIRNSGNVDSKGPVTIAVSASTTSGVAGTVINSVSPSPVIRANGGTVTEFVPFKTLPDLPNNSYFITASVTDPNGGSSVASTTATTTIAAPFISLALAFGNIPKTVLTAGAPLIITNSGNIDDANTFTATIGFATDSGGTNIVGTSAGTLAPSKLTVRAGKTGTIHVTGWGPLFKSVVTSGPFFLTVTLTDASGNSATAVSSGDVG